MKGMGAVWDVAFDPDGKRLAEIGVQVGFATQARRAEPQEGRYRGPVATDERWYGMADRESSGEAVTAVTAVTNHAGAIQRADFGWQKGRRS